MTFHERANLLKAVGLHLIAEKEPLYELSTTTGATRADSWIDIEGGAGVLLGYASKGRRELPDGNVLVDGEPEVLARDGSFLAAHVATPRHGVAFRSTPSTSPSGECWRSWPRHSSPAFPPSSSPPPLRPFSPRPWSD
ncbi:MAG: hypothetical protein Ct9H300mP12_09180 [Acidimicrobiales bacterium]|nr:MAG: hypothetical protein Ct9H300mP12_09180 [Acidimicrobiales bacterium]